MSDNFPAFTLHPVAQAICDNLLKVKAFASQKQIETEASQLMVLAHAATAKGHKVASVLLDPPSYKEVLLKYMSRMYSLGLVGNILMYADPMAEYNKDPKAYIDQLVASGAFESFDDFAEQALCLIGWGWAEISMSRSLCSVNEAAQTYSEWHLPLQDRVK